MKLYETSKIKNFCLLGHGNSGKTSLAEAMLSVGTARGLPVSGTGRGDALCRCSGMAGVRGRSAPVSGWIQRARGDQGGLVVWRLPFNFILIVLKKRKLVICFFGVTLGVL